MSQEEAWIAVARECPRRIIPALHRRGEYLHGTIPGLAGKVLCTHITSTRPPGWIATPAQQQAERVVVEAESVQHA